MFVLQSHVKETLQLQAISSQHYGMFIDNMNMWMDPTNDKMHLLV